MLAFAQFVAVFATTIFAGAAVYITFVEHPARMACSTEMAATHWAPSYKRATVMQAPLALVGSLAGLAAWWLGGGLWWLVAALVILSVVPFTLLVIEPAVNKALLTPGRDLRSLETRHLLVQWGRLHAVRSALGIIASVIFVWHLVWSA